MEEEGNTNKILGYSFIAVGVIMILFAVFDIFQTFTGKSSVVPLFNFNPISVDLSKMVENAPKNSNLTQELIASDVLNKPTNLLFHLLLMGFIATAGQKIAGIGTTLVRTIKVDLKEDIIKKWK